LAEPPPPSQEPDVRFSLANERTLLAYQRTAIGLVGAAVAVVHFLGDSVLGVLLGLALLVTGMAAAIGGYQHFRRVELAIRSGDALTTGPAAHVLSVAMLVCLALAGVYVVVQAVG
jgi:putative membrane protein